MKNRKGVAFIKGLYLVFFNQKSGSNSPQLAAWCSKGCRLLTPRSLLRGSSFLNAELESRTRCWYHFRFSLTLSHDIFFTIYWPPHDDMKTGECFTGRNKTNPVDSQFVSSLRRKDHEDKTTHSRPATDSCTQFVQESVAVLRRTQNNQQASASKVPEQFLIGQALVDHKTYQVTIGEQSHSLTSREIKLLEIFQSRSREFLSRDDLLNAAWGRSTILVLPEPLINMLSRYAKKSNQTHLRRSSYSRSMELGISISQHKPSGWFVWRWISCK